jgi:hypothetical protein
VVLDDVARAFFPTEWKAVERDQHPAVIARWSWPQNYWTATDDSRDNIDRNTRVANSIADRSELIALAIDFATDLSASVPDGPDHTALREILILADHNAYHIGELAILRQLDQTWGKPHAS